MRSSVTICLAVVVILWFYLPVTTVASDNPAGAVLHLTNSGFLPGELLGSDDPNVLRWYSPLFTEPFQFPLDVVSAVHHAPPSVRPKPTGEYCFELVDDDTLYGDLLGLTDTNVELETARFGRVHVRREHVRRFYRWQGEELVYLGPHGLADWKKSSATAQWRDEGGLPATDESGASLFGDFGIPAQAAIEFELSWSQKPDFLFALGVNDQTATVQQAFRFEVWDGDLVVLGESPRDADVVSVQLVRGGPGHVHVKAYLDQEKQRLLLFSRRGQAIAAFNIRSRKPQVHTGLRLTNKKGDVRLESLRISRWSGAAPREVRSDQSGIHRTDGSIVYGRIVAFDPESKQFIIRNHTSETLVEADTLADVFLSPLSEESTLSTGSVTSASKRTLRALYQDGTRLSGELKRIEETHLSLICPGVKEPLQLPLTGLRSLISLQHGKTPTASLSAGKNGRLEMEGVSLKGRLANGSEQPDASCLVWHPDKSLNASPLHLGVSGRIVFRDRPARRRKAVAPKARPNRRPVGIGGFFQKLVTGNVPAKRSTGESRRSLHLRTGDTIPCEVTSIDDEGVSFKTPISEATFVPHEVVKAIELGAMRSSPKLNKTQRKRLLTVPRLLRDSPPTHLICSKNGDFLRARLLAMDDKRLQVEVRLETKELPRDRVTRVIWLHADELSGEVATVAANSSQATRVQTLRADGNRLTFFAEKLNDNTLIGESDVLGACQADLDEVDQVLFGAFIEQAAARLIYHRWKLHHAIEPKFAQVGEGDAAASRPSGTESPLVGQPAPNVELDLLDGHKFRLADHKGRVVVLDFWATWCGPCLQTMPLVDGVVREFADEGVELFAVNLEEQPKQITSMLERHKLKMSVALDRDGVAAARYNVTAIPQTVVIDREGRVVRLYVGGGPKLADPLRDALRELSLGEPLPATSP
jgi:thiol-disulfide isomerase/thioredoxin